MTTEKNNSLLAAYLVDGADLLKREAVLKRLRIRLEKLGDLSFNSDEFEGPSADGSQVVSACRTVPFASEKRLVTIKEADKLPKKAVDALVDYLNDPSDTTVVLLISDKLAKNTRLYKAVAGLGKDAVIDCTPPKRYEMARQVRAMAVTHGITLTDKAAERMVEFIGEDTLRIDAELKKLALSHGSSDPIGEDEIVDMIAQVAEVKPWDFVDAFSARDLKECMRMLPLMPSMTPYALLGRCTSRIRELICAKSLSREGGDSPSRIAKELKMPDWKVKHHGEWARRFDEAELRSALISAARAEKEMKSGSDPQGVFVDWLIEVMHP